MQSLTGCGSEALEQQQHKLSRPRDQTLSAALPLQLRRNIAELLQEVKISPAFQRRNFFLDYFFIDNNLSLLTPVNVMIVIELECELS